MQINIKLCCDSLAANVCLVDTRGSHVVSILSDSGESTYWGILYRNYDYDNYTKRPNEYKTITIETKGGYKFCPFCGKQLPNPNDHKITELAHIIKTFDVTR